jgi:type IV secretion system protein VirB5
VKKLLISSSAFVVSLIFACQVLADVHVIDETLIKDIKDQLENADTSVRKNQKKQIDIVSGNREKGEMAEGAGGAEKMKQRNYLSKSVSGTAYDQRSLPKNYICHTGATCDGFKGTLSGAKSMDARKSLKPDFSTSTLNDIAALEASESEKRAQEMAVYQAMLEEAYLQSTKRFETIQYLMDDIKNATEPKAIWDLQTRIQAEQMMLQNEQIKLTALGQLRSSAAEMYERRKMEINEFKRRPDPEATSAGTTAALIAAQVAVKALNTTIKAAVNAAWDEEKNK